MASMDNFRKMLQMNNWDNIISVSYARSVKLKPQFMAMSSFENLIPGV